MEKTKKKKRPVEFLIDNIDNPNIAKDLSKEEQENIARLVMTGFDLDDSSRKDWKTQTEEGIKIAEQITEKKNYPWENASNVKFPLIATSAIQFAARAYPNIVNDKGVVKAAVVGEDPDQKKAARAKRVSEHMSYQLMEQMTEWDENTDQLLHSLPVVGTLFRKTFFDPLLQRPSSQLCMPLDVVVHMDTKSLATCRRVTHIIHLYKNDVIERERSGMYCDCDADYMEDVDEEQDRQETFLEQHRWLDLDGDGYEEPYIATIHKASGTLVRLTARYDNTGIEINDKNKVKKITAVDYFTAYFFIPSPSGKFYALGFAHLLGPINESINTTINILLDAGHLATVQGGFIGRGARFQGGKMMFRPGEWKPVDVVGGTIKDNIVPLPTKEPSNVLFSLLGMLNDTGMKLASVSETMTGETPSQNTPATTTLAVIEQGLKVFTAIYKRIFRSLKQEFAKIYRLNGLYLNEEEYYRILDVQQKVFRSDYNFADLNVQPVADPNLSNEATKLARVQALMQTLQMNPLPEAKMEILRQYYEAIDAQNINILIPTDQQGKIQLPQQPPDPKAIEMQLKTVESKKQTDMEMQKLPYELELLESQIDEVKARTKKTLAEADSTPVMNMLETIDRQVKAIQNDTKLEIERIKAQGGANGQASSGDGRNGGGAGGLASPQNNQEGVQVPGGMPANPEALSGQGSLPFAGELGQDGTGVQPDGGEDTGTRPYPPDTE